MKKNRLLSLISRFGNKKPPRMATGLCLGTILMIVQAASGQAVAQRAVTLDLKDAGIEQFFREIKRQTSLDFAYNDEQTRQAGLITVSARNENVDGVLDRVLTPRGLAWRLSGSVITVTRAAAPQTASFTVRGRVTDKDGNPLPGVSVVVRGSVAGTSTGRDGEYTLTVRDNGPATLLYSFIGMKGEQRTATSDQTIDVVMAEERFTVRDVIVTGFQNIRNEDATGSFAVVRAEDLEKRYSGKLIERLEGLIPGLVSYNTGLNQSSGGYTIRGINTFTNSINPLIVVDGLPVEGTIDDVNMDDVASVTVLRDAAAAAIYGARSANGVLVITTKSGRTDKVEIGISADFTIHRKPDYGYLNHMDGTQQVELEAASFRAAYANPNYTMFLGMLPMLMPQGYLTPVYSLFNQRYTGAITDAQLDEGIEALKGHNFLDDYTEHALRNEFVQRYNLSVRGRSGKLASNFVANFASSNTGLIHTHDRTVNLSYKGDYPAAKWLDLHFGANINMNRNKSHYNTYATDPFSVPAYIRMFGEDGNRAYYSTMLAYAADPNITGNSELKPMTFNHLDELERDFVNNSRTNSRFFAHADFRITEALTAGAQFQYESIRGAYSGYSEVESYTSRYMYNMFTTPAKAHLMPDGGSLRSSDSNGAYYTFRVQADYNKTFRGKHFVNAIAGAEVRQTGYRETRGILLGYDDQLLTHQMGYTDLDAMRANRTTAMFPYSEGNCYSTYIAPWFGVSETEHHYTSYYANANYVCDHRYSLFASLRKDYTDLFGTDRKFRGRPLWSVGAAWNISNEAFMQDATFVNALKLRLSYGCTGNIDQYTSSYMTASSSTNAYTGARMSTLDVPPNDQLRWEKTSTFNIGADYTLWEGRLGGTLDWYRKYSTDLLALTPLDPSEGFSSLTINNGEVLNTGVEFSLTGRWLRTPGNHLRWNTTFNLGLNKNEIRRVDLKPVSAMDVIGRTSAGPGLVEGRPIRALYSLPYAGLAPLANGATGREVQWMLANGDLTTGTPQTFLPEDAVYSGALDPKTTLGLSNELAYGNWTLSCLLVYYGGHKMRADQVYNFYSYLGYNYTGTVSKELAKGWSDANPDSDLPGSGYYAPTASGATFMQYADRYIQPAGFIKLRSLNVSYRVPENVCKKIGADGLTLRAQGNNLWMWTENGPGVDPEANNAYAGGRTLRTPASFTFSLNVQF